MPTDGPSSIWTWTGQSRHFEQLACQRVQHQLATNGLPSPCCRRHERSFYAQVETLLDPSLRGKPVGVQQKYLVVTANYEARAAGVGKMSSLSDALQACPHLIVRNGETLTRYRQVSL